MRTPRRARRPGSISLGALLLLLPFCVAIVWFSLPYVERSWAILERSRETSGLPLVFALKTLIPLFAAAAGAAGRRAGDQGGRDAYPSPADARSGREGRRGAKTPRADA